MSDPFAYVRGPQESLEEVYANLAKGALSKNLKLANEHNMTAEDKKKGERTSRDEAREQSTRPQAPDRALLEFLKVANEQYMTAKDEEKEWDVVSKEEGTKDVIGDWNLVDKGEVEEGKPNNKDEEKKQGWDLVDKKESESHNRGKKRKRG